jgi:acyl dehydratase
MPEDIVADLRRRATPWKRGHRFEEFEVGQRFRHHWGRTLTESDNILFTTLTLHYNPIYFNAAYAREEGHEGIVVCPLLLFAVVFGLSVEDLSENGGPFLGVDDLTYHRAVKIGETVFAESIVTACRETKSRPDFGIVTWRTVGRTSDDETLIEFTRSNLVRKKD